MEHRQSARIPANVDLRLYKRGDPVATGRLRDLSKDGLFLATDFDDVRANEVLEIEIPPTSEPDSPANRMRAIVVYKDDAGLGLMLADDGEVRGLSQLYSWLRHRARKKQDKASKKAAAPAFKVRKKSR